MAAIRLAASQDPPRFLGTKPQVTVDNWGELEMISLSMDHGTAALVMEAIRLLADEREESARATAFPGTKAQHESDAFRLRLVDVADTQAHLAHYGQPASV